MKKLTDIAWIFGIIVIGFFIYEITKKWRANYTYNDNLERTKAVITDNQNYNGNQPVQPAYSHSYSFKIKGKTFTGNSHDSTLKIGDTIDIEYDKNIPELNKPLHSK